jgi:hypothetical protein
MEKSVFRKSLNGKCQSNREIGIMNKKQKVILGVVLVIIGLMIVFPQITVFHPNQEYYDRPIDSPIGKAAQYMQIITKGYGFILRDYATVNYTVLAFRCLIMGGVGGFLIYALKKKQTKGLPAPHQRGQLISQ